jgi:hypothetical protein
MTKHGEKPPLDWQERAAAGRKRFGELAARVGPAIEAELATLDRAALVARLKAEGHTSITVSGRTGPVDALLTPLGRAIPDSDVRSMVYDVLLLKAEAAEEAKPRAKARKRSPDAS